MLRRLPLALLFVSACRATAPVFVPPVPGERPPPNRAGAVGSWGSAAAASGAATTPSEAPPLPATTEPAVPAPVEAAKPAALVVLEPPYSALGHARLATE